MASVFLLTFDNAGDEQLYGFSTEKKAEEVALQLIRKEFEQGHAQGHFEKFGEARIQKLKCLLYEPNSDHDLAALFEHWFWMTNGTSEVRIEELTLDLPLRK